MLLVRVLVNYRPNVIKLLGRVKDLTHEFSAVLGSIPLTLTLFKGQPESTICSVQMRK